MTVVARPEQVVVDPGGTPARVQRRVFEGASTSVTVEVGGEVLAMRAAGVLVAAPGEQVPVALRGPVLAFAP